MRHEQAAAAVGTSYAQFLTSQGRGEKQEEQRHSRPLGQRWWSEYSRALGQDQRQVQQHEQGQQRQGQGWIQCWRDWRKW